MWSADASARAVATRDFEFGDNGASVTGDTADTAGGRADHEAWLEKLAALDDLEVVVEADIPTLPAAAIVSALAA